MTPIPPKPLRGLRNLRLLLGCAVAALCVGGGVASAQTTETPDEAVPTDGVEGGAIADGAEATPTDETADPAGTDPATADGGSTETDLTDSEPVDSDEGTAEPASAGGSVRLKTEDVNPRTTFFRGKRKAKFRYEVGGTGTVDLKVLLIKRGSGKVMRVWKKDDVPHDRVKYISWGGQKPGGGEAPKGKYFFKVKDQAGGELDRSRAKGERSFRLYPNKFPVQARHDYWDGFGAGRGHMGQDIGAKCGEKVVSARAGKVVFKGYQGSGAGNYLVIDGKNDRKDYVYMHLRKPALVRQGERVRGGEKIGEVGDTGRATGCHLHFELWKGGWYDGGHAMSSVTKYLKRWDRWS